MKIQNNSDLNFCAKVNNVFVKNAQKYCLKRGLCQQYNSFNKTLDKFDTFGSKNSEIIYLATNQEEGILHTLCLKNKNLNNKSALIIKTSKKFYDIVKFFTNITDNMMLAWEDCLKKI